MNIKPYVKNNLLKIIEQSDEESYVPLAWLESDPIDQPYIDTGVFLGNNTGYILECSISNEGGTVIPFGSRSSSGNTRQWVNITWTSGFSFGWDNYYGTSPNFTPDTSMHVYTVNYMNSRTADIDGTYRTNLPSSATTQTFPAYLFAANNYGTASYRKSRIRVKSLKITVGERIIRDFQPALRLRDNKPGMRDRITNKFYTNKGPGEFTYEVGDTYVQDGLVAWYDGIENSAIGVHDNNAQTWTNLVGGMANAEFMAGARRWKHNGLFIIGGIDRWSIQVGTWFKNRTNCTIETTIHPMGWYKSEWNRILSNSESGGIIMAGSVGGLYAQRYNGSGYSTASYYATPITIPTTMSLVSSESELSIAISGSVQATTATSGKIGQGSTKLALSYEPSGDGSMGSAAYGNYGAMTGIYYSIRLYSRDLTVEELVHNSSIDRIRFGI